MSTLKQIVANRANALKSTGPRTSAGKARSSRNATRHGLLAETVVLEGEDRSRFYDLLKGLIEENQPKGFSEQLLIENMAVARWRQMRLWGFEKVTLTDEIERRNAEAPPDAPPADPHATAARAFQAVGQKSRALDLVHRYETSYSRMYGRSLDRLKLYRSQPRKQNEQQETTP